MTPALWMLAAFLFGAGFAWGLWALGLFLAWLTRNDRPVVDAIGEHDLAEWRKRNDA